MTTTRHCLLLDLREDPALIAEYEAHHQAVWPEVLGHIRAQGISSMEIFRLGTRLCMIMETDDAIFDAGTSAASATEDAVICAWESLMWRFQAPTPWTKAGEKWTPAQRIFSTRPI